MKKSEKKNLAKLLDTKFIISLFIYALGFAFVATTGCHLAVTEIMKLDVELSEWMVVVLPTLLLLFVVYTFGTITFLGMLGKKNN